MVTINGAFTFADASKANCPVLVQAGGKDAIFTLAEERETAERYNAKLMVYEGQGHNLMAEPAWEKVASDIIQWATQEVNLP